MATAAPPTTPPALEPERRFLLPGVGWSGYEALLGVIGDGRTRVTYLDGDAELMAPSDAHDAFKTLLGRLIETVTEELNIPCVGLGSTTWRKQGAGGGLEADECYYLANAFRVRGRRGNLDLDTDPPPDLAIEVEISRGALDRLAAYAVLGVPEVWRYDGSSLVIHQLRPDGTYATVPVSPGLPGLTAAEVGSWLDQARDLDDQTEWGRRLRAWVRVELVPRREGH